MGFGFDNEATGSSFSEFTAVYGDNAYICIGAFGFCATHIPDPLYAAVYYPIYRADHREHRRQLRRHVGHLGAVRQRQAQCRRLRQQRALPRRHHGPRRRRLLAQQRGGPAHRTRQTANPLGVRAHQSRPAGKLFGLAHVRRAVGRQRPGRLHDPAAPGAARVADGGRAEHEESRRRVWRARHSALRRQRRQSDDPASQGLRQQPAEGDVALRGLQPQRRHLQVFGVLEDRRHALPLSRQHLERRRHLPGRHPRHGRQRDLWRERRCRRRRPLGPPRPRTRPRR